MDDAGARAMLAQATPSLRAMVVASLGEGHDLQDLYVLVRRDLAVGPQALEISVCSRRRVLEDQARGTLPPRMRPGFVRLIVAPVPPGHLRALVGDGAGHWKSGDVVLSLVRPGALCS